MIDGPIHTKLPVNAWIFIFAYLQKFWWHELLILTQNQMRSCISIVTTKHASNTIWGYLPTLGTASPTGHEVWKMAICTVFLTSGSASLSLWVLCLLRPSLEAEYPSKPTSSGRSCNKTGQSGCWWEAAHGKVSRTHSAGSSHAALRPYS